jgi:hypothetical protein
MVPIPVSLLLPFIVSKLKARSVGFTLLILALIAAAAGRIAVQRSFISEAPAAELRDFKKQIADPPSTLVIAPHGLEWWAGYFLDTPVRSSLDNETLNQYRRVLYLRTTIDCPPEIVPPFPMPAISPSATKTHFGRYFEVYEAN